MHSGPVLVTYPNYSFSNKIIKNDNGIKGRPCMNVKRSLLCTSLRTPAVVDSLAAWFPVAVMCIMESPWEPLHQTPVLNNLCKLKKHSAYKIRIMWHSQSLFHTYTDVHGPIHSLFCNNRFNGFAPPPPSLSEGWGHRRKRQQWGKHKNSRYIAQTSAGTEYNSLSFQQPSLCIGRIKHLWCSHTFNPSHKAL